MIVCEKAKQRMNYLRRVLKYPAKKLFNYQHAVSGTQKSALRERPEKPWSSGVKHV